MQGSTENSTLNTGLHNLGNTRDAVQGSTENDRQLMWRYPSTLRKMRPLSFASRLRSSGVTCHAEQAFGSPVGSDGVIPLPGPAGSGESLH